MKYVIGIDGGGTKTLLKIADLNGKLLASCEGGPSNINSIKVETVTNTLKDVIDKGIEKIGETKENCCSLCIGSAGVDRPQEQKIMKDIISSLGISNKIVTVNDAETALYGGISGGIGIILVSGTGSISFGRNKEGFNARCGGWGHILGDEGSGYDIGKKALTAITRSYDGREPETLLTSLVLKKLNITKPDDLIDYVYRSGAGKKEIASLAQVVDEAYKKGDKRAEKILKESAYELFLCVIPIVEKLEFGNKAVTLALNGSVLTKNKYINNTFKKFINEKYPLIEITNMKDDAAWGAVLIALDTISRDDTNY